MFHRKCRERLAKAQARIATLEADLQTCQSGLTSLKNEKAGISAELRSTSEKFSEKEANEELILAGFSSYRRALERVVSLAGDSRPDLMAEVARVCPDLVAARKLPVISVQISAAYDGRIRPKKFSAFCGILAAILEEKYKDVLLAPMLDLSSSSKDGWVYHLINVTSRYRGDFGTCCGAMESLLRIYSPWRSIYLQKMDRVQQLVEIQCIAKY